MPPVIVVEGSEAAFARTVAEVGAAGWRIVAGFEGRSAPAEREVRTGAVATSQDASAALLAVLAGAGVVVHGCAEREILDRLLGDLRHVGPVELRRIADAAAPTLDEDARAILARLAAGQTLGEAAAELGLSRRTADRRLAEARAALGVERTVEAVAKARRLGWIG